MWRRVAVLERRKRLSVALLFTIWLRKSPSLCLNSNHALLKSAIELTCRNSTQQLETPVRILILGCLSLWAVPIISPPSTNPYLEAVADLLHEEKEKENILISDQGVCQVLAGIVDALIPICRRQDNLTLQDMLLAGVETSSTTIEWAMSELLKNPRTLARAQQELNSVVGRHRLVKESDLGRCEYLQCVIKETFRLHPPVPLLVPRESREDCCVGEYLIPAKTRVQINVWAIGRDESIWEDANSFRPERFIGKDMDMRGQDFELIPFGSGRRGCPGISAGLRVVEVALAQLLHCYDWSVEGEEVKMEEAFGLTVPRKSPLFARPVWRLDNQQLSMHLG